MSPADDAALRSWIESRLLAALGLAGRGFELELPEGGTASSVRRLRVEDGPALIVRAHAHRLGAVRTAAALRHLESLGLPGPRLVLADTALAARLIPGASAGLPYITVETLIEGMRHAEVADAATTRRTALQLAELLALYHRITRPVWGWPDRERRISWSDETLRVIGRMAKDLRAHEWLTEEQHRQVDTALMAWRAPLARRRPFHLVHNDANRHNVIVTPGATVVLIDLHRLSYEPFEEEVVNALYHFCRKDADLGREFLAAYLDRVDAGARAAWDFFGGFFTAINYLKRMHRRAHQNPGLPAADPKLLRWRAIALESAVVPRSDGPAPA